MCEHVGWEALCTSSLSVSHFANGAIDTESCSTYHSLQMKVYRLKILLQLPL